MDQQQQQPETAYVLARLRYEGDAIRVARVGVFSERQPTTCDEQPGLWALVISYDAPTYARAEEIALYAVRTYYPELAALLEVV